jgi:S1-C subfamily serine protease
MPSGFIGSRISFYLDWTLSFLVFLALRDGRVAGDVMRGACNLFIVALLCAIVGTPAFAKGPYGSIRIGEWKGGAYTDDSTGAFSHCAAGGPYRSGVYVVLSEDAKNDWTLGFANDAFNFASGYTFWMDLVFDGEPLRLWSVAVSPHLVGTMLPSNVLAKFRKSHLMAVDIGGQNFEFQLPSTDRLAAAVHNCVAETKTEGIANIKSISFDAPMARPAASSNQKASQVTHQQGTGFVVSAAGHVLSNYHVIKGCIGDIQGNLSGESPAPLRIVSTDETNDLALLQASRSFANVPALRGTAVHAGDSIVAIGYPYHGLLTSDFTVTTGIVSSLSGLLNDTRYLQISAPVQPGNSGGPLLDMEGNVVGVVAAKINAIKFAKMTGDIPENINFAVKIGAVRDFLDNSAVSYNTAESKQEIKTPEIANNARAFTLLVACAAKEE